MTTPVPAGKLIAVTLMRSITPTYESATGRPQANDLEHNLTMESGSSTQISQNEMLILQGVTMTATKVDTPYPTRTARTVDVVPPCTASLSPGTLCWLDALTPTPDPTQTPIQPCTLLTPDRMMRQPCYWELSPTPSAGYAWDEAE